MVIDLHDVEFMSSACLSTLVGARRRLMQAGLTFQPSCRRRGLFAFFADRADALAAIRLGEHDPLILCNAQPYIKDLFVVC